MACDSPFDTTVTHDGPIFQIAAELSTLRLTTSAFVDLSWPAIGIDDFSEIRIHRRYPQSLDTTQSSWRLRARITEPQAHSWRDTIYDDESLRYQVQVILGSGPSGSSEVGVEIPATTHLVVPDEVDSISTAALSPLMDDGDTVLVMPGIYPTSNLAVTGKAIVILGAGGARRTRLERPPTSTDSIMIKLAGSLIQGFTIEGGDALFGGGIYAAGSTVIRQCLIRANRSTIGSPQAWGGFGGGLYLLDQARVENCLIVSNSSDKRGGGIFVDPDAGAIMIVNCTIYGNQATGQFSPQPGGVGGGVAATPGTTMRNCIIVNNTADNIAPGPAEPVAPTVTYSNSDDAWLAGDDTNSAGNPLFVNTGALDFHLLPDSICRDAGDPDPAFNDPDGSRNDMGAFGGPHGDWLTEAGNLP